MFCCFCIRCKVLWINVFGLVVSFLVLCLVKCNVVVFVLLWIVFFWYFIIKIVVVIRVSKIVDSYENFIVVV